MKKIDIHCHTTNRRVKGVRDEYPTLEKIAGYMQQYDIEKTVVLASYFPHKGTGISNFRLLNWIAGNPLFAMFASLDFDFFFYQGINEIQELAERKLIKGVKIYTCYQHIDLKSDRFKSLVSLVAKNNLPLMFHVGYSYSCMSKTGKVAYTEAVAPKDLEFLAKENPQLNFIFSHMGKPFTDGLIDVAKAHDNIYTDTSGLIDSDHTVGELDECVLAIQKFLFECGPKKLLFGTDFPVQTHEDSVYMVETAMKHFKDSDKQEVYYNNAFRIS